MALSDYERLVLGENGEPCESDFKINSNLSIEAYKNWLYLRSEKMWHENTGFIKPIIAHMWEGHLEICGCSIQAIRENNGRTMYFLVESYVEDNGGHYRYFGGIATYGWEDTLPKLIEHFKIDKTQYEDFIQGSSYDSDANGNTCQNFFLEGLRKDGGYDKFEAQEKGNEHLDSEYIGITNEMYRGFIQWVEKEKHPSEDKLNWLLKIKSGTPQCFNQGDLFFRDRTDGLEIRGTEPGEKKTPMLMGALNRERNEGST